MEEFIMKVGVKAKSKESAQRILTNLLRVRTCLSDTDLETLANILETKPGIVETAKSLL